MKFGAEKKKLIVLGILLAIAAWVLLSGGDDPRQQAAARRPQAQPASPVAAPLQQTTRSVAEPNISRDTRRPGRGPGRQSVQEFKPTLKPKRPEDRVDPMTVEPTLKLELLTKLRNVKAEGGSRSLFEFTQAPPPKTEIKDVRIVPKRVKVGPQLPPVVENKTPQPAPKPTVPIPLKFYGFTNPSRQGVKRAFFLAGDEIFVAGEGETVKKRYQVIRIGVNSVVVKDVEQDSQQTLPLIQEQQG